MKTTKTAATKTFDYAFDKVRDLDAKNPFSKSAQRDLYTKAARNAFQRMQSSGKKPNLPEEVEQVDELKASTLNSYIAKRQGNTANRMAHAMRKIGGKPSKHDVYNTGLKRAQQKIDDKRKKETGMNPQKPRSAAAPAYPLGGYDPRSNRSYSEEVKVDEMVRDIPLAKKVEQEYSDKMMKDFLARGGQIKQGKPQKAPKNTLRFIARGSLASGERTITKTGSKSFTKRMGEEVEQVDEISAVTHAKYRTAARADIRTQARNLDTDNKASGRIEKRIAGLARSTGLEKVKKMTSEQMDSVPASKALQKAHEDERKKRGLPDPSYYLKLRDQKKKEIEDMKKNEEVSLSQEELDRLSSINSTFNEGK